MTRFGTRRSTLSHLALGAGLFAVSIGVSVAGIWQGQPRTPQRTASDEVPPEVAALARQGQEQEPAGPETMSVVYVMNDLEAADDLLAQLGPGAVMMRIEQPPGGSWIVAVEQELPAMGMPIIVDLRR